jgi:hypothetical protein
MGSGIACCFTFGMVLMELLLLLGMFVVGLLEGIAGFALINCHY